jgi:hypothetical protein
MISPAMKNDTIARLHDDDLQRRLLYFLRRRIGPRMTLK